MYSRKVHVDDSSNIELVEYDPEIKALKVTFLRGGGTYLYEKVPAKTFGELISADSVGKYFQANVKDKFPTVRMKK